MLENYPKTRPDLPKAFEEIYARHYKSNREGATAAASLAQRMEAWLHKKVAEDVAGEAGLEKRTLELGAGTLNQLQHEPSVKTYDIVEPFSALYSGSPFLGRVRNVYSDIKEIPSEMRYDRVTSVAVLEHLCELPEIVARSAALLAEGGVFRAAVPSEGTALWRLGWMLTTGLEFKLKYGLDYGVLMKHEHVNTAQEIREVLGYFFSEVACQVFGVSPALSLYQHYECRHPIKSRYQKFL